MKNDREVKILTVDVGCRRFKAEYESEPSAAPSL